MNPHNSTKTYIGEPCRNTQAEIDRDTEALYGDTPEQILRDKVAELMHKDCTDEDSLVVLMESALFSTALRKVLDHRHTQPREHDQMVYDSICMISIAETVLSNWVESSL